MTLESTISKNRYIGNGATAQFPFTFKAWKTDQVKVVAGDGATEQDVTARCTVALTATGGTVTFPTAPASGTIIVIRRGMPFTQEDDYRNGTRFDGEEIEDRFDQDCAERQDLKLDIDRAVKIPETSNQDPDDLLQDIFDARDESEEHARRSHVWAEGEDDEVEELGGQHSSKGWAQLFGLLEEDNIEFIRMYKDADGRFLWGIRRNGSIEWAKGLPAPVRAALRELGFVETDPFWLRKVTDADGRLLWGIRKDGTVEWKKGVPAPVKEWVAEAVPISAGKSADDIAATVDAGRRVLASIRADGTASFKGDVEIQGRLSGCNLPRTSDWTDAESLQIPEPRCARVNFIGLGFVPTVKGQTRDCWMEFWDMAGNYFRKRVTVDAQGRTSLAHPKRNIAIDMFNDDWDGKGFNLRIGDWVFQDSFHLKAYWNEPFRCTNPVCYKLYNDMLLTRGPAMDRAWKRALPIQRGPGIKTFGGESSYDLLTDTGARGVPDGFPCIVYFDGQFFGVYSWQMKKDAVNCHMEKNDDNGLQVYLEGTLTEGSLLETPAPAWNLFEIRFPRKLLTMGGKKYSDDFPEEIMDDSSDYYDASKDDCTRSNATKATILNFNAAVRALIALDDAYVANPTQANLAAVKSKFEAVFDLDSVIDYAILDDVEGQRDSYGNNTHWKTWDGEKWFVTPYDMDISFGWAWTQYASGTAAPSFLYGGYCRPNWTAHKSVRHAYPSYYVYRYYRPELNARWAFLRRAGIIDAAAIASRILDWHDRVGWENMDLDRARWSADNFGMGDAIVNTSCWSLVLDNVTGKPVEGTASTYSPSTAYAVDDEVFYGLEPSSGFYKYKCVRACKGTLPLLKINFHDSVYRVYDWLSAQIANMDQVYCFAG